jgi:hypothetical protein
VSPNVTLNLVIGGACGLLLSPLLAFLLIMILRRIFPGQDTVASASEGNSQQTDEPAHGATSDARTDPFAITSFILGICSLILWPLGAIPAIVLGHLSRGRIRKNPALKGNGFAIAGLSLGYLFLAASLAYLIIAVVFINLRIDAMQKANEPRSIASAVGRTSSTARSERNVSDPSQAEIEVRGAVRNTGRFRIPNDASLLDAMATSGGWTGNADLQKIRIEIPGAPEAQIHDLTAILRGDTVNPVITPGSTIAIPEK